VLFSTLPTDAPHLEVETSDDGKVTRITVRGEADISNVELLIAAFDSVNLDGTPAVHLYLAELTFCDVRTLCHVLEFARTVKQNGYDIAIHDSTSTVQKLARLLGVDGEVAFE